MQHKVPRIITFSGLEGIDKRIQQIQLTMNAGISWLQYSFGLCDKILKGEDVIPVCYIDRVTDPIDMRPFPDDGWNSYSFWDLDGAMIPDYDDNFSGRRYPVLNYPVACLFVINLNSINSDSKVARSMARQDILDFFHQKIRFAGIFALNEMVEQDIDAIFSGFTIENKAIILRQNVAAFRVAGTITFKQDC